MQIFHGVRFQSCYIIIAQYIRRIGKISPIGVLKSDK